MRRDGVHVYILNSLHIVFNDKNSVPAGVISNSDTLKSGKK